MQTVVALSKESVLLHCYNLTSLLYYTLGFSSSYRLGYLHMLGYLLYLAVRVWGSSFNYIFMSNSHNIAAICVGVAVSVQLCVDDLPTAITSRPPPPPKSSSDKTKPPNTSPSPRFVASGLALGSLFFLTSFLYSEVSIITRWSVGPQPFPGPQPYPWG